jgi:hypothetical protein
MNAGTLIQTHISQEQQAVDSLVPLLYRETNNLTMSVSLVVDTIKKAVGKFDRTAELLRSKYAEDSEIELRLRTHIEANQFNCTGNLFWSLRTGRYGVNSQTMTGGVTITL